MTSNGTYAVLASFSRGASGSDAVNPYGRSLQASDGNFYGVAGAGYCGEGAIFRLTASGTLTTFAALAAGTAQTRMAD